MRCSTISGSWMDSSRQLPSRTLTRAVTHVGPHQRRSSMVPWLSCTSVYPSHYTNRWRLTRSSDHWYVSLLPQFIMSMSSMLTHVLLVSCCCQLWKVEHTSQPQGLRRLDFLQSEARSDCLHRRARWKEGEWPASRTLKEAWWGWVYASGPRPVHESLCDCSGRLPQNTDHGQSKYYYVLHFQSNTQTLTSSVRLSALRYLGRLRSLGKQRDTQRLGVNVGTHSA